jgi:hypothetical protein
MNALLNGQLDPKLMQTSESALQTKHILETLGFSAMEFGGDIPQPQLGCRPLTDSKRVEQWKSNLTAPSLGVFRVEEGPTESPFLSVALTNNVSSEPQPAKENPAVSASFRWPSATELKLKLLAENAKIKDKFLYSKKASSQVQDNAAASAEPVLATREADIQEWVKSQRLQNKEIKKKESNRNIFNEDCVDPSSMIYVASMAAAAATSAGLTSLQNQQKLNSQDGYTLPRKSTRKLTSKDKMKLSLMKWGREDSGLGASAVSVPSTSDNDFSLSDSTSKNAKRGKPI